MEAGNKYFRRLRLTVDGDRLTLRPPRAGLGASLGFLTFSLLTANALIPSFHFLRFQTPGWNGFITHPWFGMGLGVTVFFAVSRLFRGRIVFDRREREIRRGRRLVARFDQVARVEVDTKFRIQVMNAVALVLDGKRELSLLLYDSRPNNDVWEFANTIGKFIGAPVEGERT